MEFLKQLKEKKRIKEVSLMKAQKYKKIVKHIHTRCKLGYMSLCKIIDNFLIFMITICVHMCEYVTWCAYECQRRTFEVSFCVPLPVKSAIVQGYPGVGSDAGAYGKGRRFKSMGQYLRQSGK